MPPVPAAPAPAAPATAPAPQSPFTTALLSVLGAIGTGIGVLGFLTFVGGAVWIARFRGVGLSGTYAISAMPRSELIATGADQLFAPAVVALVAVALTIALVLVARWSAIDAGTWTWILVLFAAVGAALALDWFRHRVGPPFDVGVGVEFVGAMTSYALGAGVAVALARHALPTAGPHPTARVLALAVAVAATVLVYGAFQTYALNRVHPHIRPAAVVDADGRGAAGYYVGQDADTVFLGVTTPALAHADGPRSIARIVQIPLTDDSRVAVGSTLAPFKARELAADLLGDLRRDATG